MPEGGKIDCPPFCALRENRYISGSFTAETGGNRIFTPVIRTRKIQELASTVRRDYSHAYSIGL